MNPRTQVVIALALACACGVAEAQISYTNTPGGGRDVSQVHGRPIGKITTHRVVAVLELAPGVSGGAARAHPGPELLARTDGIRREWMSYWSRVTGGASTMRTNLSN